MRTSVSIVIPFFNEEANVRRVLEELLSVSEQPDWKVDFVCVQNGSQDRTEELLHELATAHPEISVVRVPVNRGYGYGIGAGIASARGEIVGYVDGDGQVSPSDVFQVLNHMKGNRAAKGIRVKRQDGVERRIISWCYNTTLRVLFFVLFRLRTRDANAKPKFLRRSDLELMNLVSDDWFIDAEATIKAASLGILWAEHPLPFLKRKAGRSHVRLKTLWEFLRNLFDWRFCGRYSDWREATNARLSFSNRGD